MQNTEQIASNIGGNTVYAQSGRDTTITASSVISDTDLVVNAGRNIDILAATNTNNLQNNSKSSSTMMGTNGGTSPKLTLYGKNDQSQTANNSATTQSTSALAANAGSISLNAGLDKTTLGTGQGNLTTQGTDFIAKEGVTLSANQVELQAIYDKTVSALHSESKSVTVGAQFAGTIGGAITQIADTANNAINTDSKRLQNALTLKAGYDTYKLIDNGSKNAKSAVDAAKAEGMPADQADAGKSGFGVSVTASISKSKSDSLTQDSTVKGSNIQAGSITINANDKSESSGDLLMEAAKLQAKAVTLGAANDILLTAGANTSNVATSNKSTSVGGGVTVAVGGQQSGISFQASASLSKGRTTGSETTYDNTLITATDLLKITSGNDTTLLGAQLAANKAIFDIGGNFNIVTQQDQSSYDSKQTSVGFNVSVCIPPLCYGTAVTGGINYSKNTLNHNYLSAVGQSGLNVGTEGFNITVAGNTSLTGAAITSSADASKNSLQTGSLSYTDLTNKESTAATSISVSVSTDSIASNLKSNVMSNLAGQASLPKTGSSQSETKSVISPATITITGTNAGTSDASKDAAATLTSRDASTANNSLKNTLSLQQVAELEAKQRQMADNLAAANAVGSVATNMIGDYAKSKNDALKAQAVAEGKDPNLVTSWGEGSAEKIALHGLAGLIEAKVGGTSALAGAFTGALYEASVPMLVKAVESLQKDQLDALEKQYSAIGQMAEGADKDQAKKQFDKQWSDLAAEKKAMIELGSIAIGATAGKLVGGNLQNASAGANIALTADQNNRQLHQKDYDYAKKNAKSIAAALSKLEGRVVTADEAEARILAEILRNSNAQTAQATGDRHDYNLRSQVGCQNLNCDGKTTDVHYCDNAYNAQLIAPNLAAYNKGVAQLGVGVTATELSDNNKKNNPVSTTVAKTGSVVVGALVLAPIAAGVAATAAEGCAANFLLCINQVGIFAGEVAAGEALPLGIGITAASVTAKTVINEAKVVNLAVTDAKILAAEGKVVDAGSAATKLVETGNSSRVLAGNGEGLFTNVERGSYSPTNSTFGQAYDFSCAAASCKMAANLTTTPESYIRQAIQTDSAGTALSNIPKGLKELGFSGTAEYSTNITTQSIALSTKNGSSVIVNVTTEGGGVHAIVVDSVKNGMAYIRDPWPIGIGSTYSVPVNSLGSVLTGKGVVIRH